MRVNAEVDPPLMASKPKEKAMSAKRTCLTWGTRGDEATRKLPGDELLPDAGLVSTRAITVDAPPDAVWP